jgi:hypothetical protein
VFLNLDHPIEGKRGINTDEVLFYWVSKEQGLRVQTTAGDFFIPSNSDDEKRFFNAVKDKDVVHLVLVNEYGPTGPTHYYLIVDKVVFYKATERKLSVSFDGGRTFTTEDPQQRVKFLEHMQDIGK